MRFIYVTGRDVRYVIGLEQIVSMMPVETHIAGGKMLRTAIVTTNPNDECWTQESVEDILRAVQAQEPHASGMDVVDVAEWAKYHGKS